VKPTTSQTDGTTDTNGDKERVNRRAVAAAKAGAEKAKGKNMATRDKRPHKSPETGKEKRPRKSPEKPSKNLEKASKVPDKRRSPRNERQVNKYCLECYTFAN
jgi:hypothetical protein